MKIKLSKLCVVMAIFIFAINIFTSCSNAQTTAQTTEHKDPITPVFSKFSFSVETYTARLFDVPSNKSELIDFLEVYRQGNTEANRGCSREDCYIIRILCVSGAEDSFMESDFELLGTFDDDVYKREGVYTVYIQYDTLNVDALIDLTANENVEHIIFKCGPIASPTAE